MKATIAELLTVSDHVDRAIANLKGDRVGQRRKATSRSCRSALDHIGEAIRRLEKAYKTVDQSRSRVERKESKVAP